MAVAGYRAGIDAGERFLESIEPDETVVLLFHSDADGCCAGAIMYRTLLEMGDELAFPVFMEKGESVYSDSLHKRVRARDASRLIVMDTGSRPREIMPDIPTMVIDHHAPEGIPPVEAFVSSFGIDPPAPASLLTYQVCRNFSRVGNLEWLAAVGSAADLGMDADLEVIRNARERYGASAIKETAVLLNSARRAPEHDIGAAFGALQGADSPLDIVEHRVPEAAILQGYREEVNTEVRRVMRTKPEISGQWALLKFHSPALVHGLVASSWLRRLANNIVISANCGYTDGNVHFSIRSAMDIDLIAELRKVREIVPGTEFGHGHPQATGGILPVSEFKAFLRAVGFPPDVVDKDPS